MRPPFKKFLQTSAVMSGALALVMSSAGVAGAAEEAPPSAGVERTSYTEDTDTNDGNTPNDVVDDGDNAHPSGKDRSVESGGSDDQGGAQSDPDDDGNGPDRSNGGADQANGPGGVDAADQDGNNGCGNDDDFEDDNEGLCLGRDGAPGQQPEDTPNPGDEDDDETPNPGQGAGDQVTICHATGSETNPFVVITVSTSATDFEGHGSHEDDIIPLAEGDACEADDTDEVPVDEVPVDEVPVDEVPVDEVPVDETPVDETPVAEVEDEVVLNPVIPQIPAIPAVPTPSRANPAVAAQPAAVLASTAAPAPQVLGAQVTRAPGALAATGDGTTDLVPFGLGLVLLGYGVQRKSKALAAARAG